MVSGLGVYYGDDFVSDDDDEHNDESVDEEVHPVFEGDGDEHVRECPYDEDAYEDEDEEQFKVGVLGDEQDEKDPEGDDQGDLLRGDHGTPPILS
jgi:hypothetical protein